jgi:hypothetical protein
VSAYAEIVENQKKTALREHIVRVPPRVIREPRDDRASQANGHEKFSTYAAARMTKLVRAVRQGVYRLSSTGLEVVRSKAFEEANGS